MKQARKELIFRMGKEVMEKFAKQLNVTPEQIIEKRKCAPINDIRYIYCKLRHEKHGVNYTAIGREVDRTAASVRAGVIHINELLSLNDKVVVRMWNSVKHIRATMVVAGPTIPLCETSSTPICVAESTHPEGGQCPTPLYYQEPEEYCMNVAEESYKSNAASYNLSRVMDQTIRG